MAKRRNRKADATEARDEEVQKVHPVKQKENVKLVFNYTNPILEECAITIGDRVVGLLKEQNVFIGAKSGILQTETLFEAENIDVLKSKILNAYETNLIIGDCIQLKFEKGILNRLSSI